MKSTSMVTDVGTGNADSGMALSDAPSFLSRRFAMWVWSLVKRGQKCNLDTTDLPGLSHKQQTQHITAKAETLWNSEIARGESGASVWRLMWYLCCTELSMGCVVSLIHGILVAGIRPLLLRQVISRASTIAINDIVFLVIVLLGEAFCQMWMKQFILDEPVLLVVAACTGLMSKRIPHIQEQAVREGIVCESTLVGSDLVRALENARSLFQFVSFGVQLIVAVCFLIFVIGMPCFIGLAICVLSVSISSALSRINKRNDKRGLLVADRRISQLRQILEGIHFIKLSAWEPSYLTFQSSLRVEETKHHRRYRTIEMVNVTIGRVTPPIASMATFVTMAFLGQPLLAQNIFSVLSVFLTLRLPLALLPNCVQALLSLSISFGRIGRQLKLRIEEPLPKPVSASMVLNFDDVELSWAPAAPILTCVSMDIRFGSTVAIVGSVASGKTTLILGMLGGLWPARGTICRSDARIGYVPQRPIVFSGTVLDNITMQHPFKEQRLWHALSVAQFENDIDSMPHGMETEIGERGTTLSGGQQTRLNIARAFYHNPSLLIADDPLAAVDVHVAAAIFEAMNDWATEASTGPDVHLRTLVMSLNQLHLMERFTQVIYLEGGRVFLQGTAADLEAAATSGSQLAQLLESARLSITCDALESGTQDKAGNAGFRESSVTPCTHALSAPLGAGVPSFLGTATLDKGTLNQGNGATKKNTNTQDGKLVKAEHRERGAISSSVPAKYLYAAGRFWVTMYISLVLISYLALAATDWWLTLWLEKERQHEEDGADIHYAGTYCALALSHAIFMLLSNMASACAGAHASRQLHAQCLSHVLQAPMRWFEETPSGRIVSKFSADISIVDLRLPTMIDNSVQMIVMTIVIVVGMCIVVPWISIFIFAVAPAYIYLDYLVNKSSREIKRITINAMSPVLTLVQEAASSRLLLRVMEQDTWLHDKLEVYLDLYNNANYVSASLLTFLRLQGALIGLCSSSLAMVLLRAMPSLVASAPGGETSVGLAISYSFIVPYFLSYVSLFLSSVRVFMTSLERVLELRSCRVPSERPWQLAVDPAQWPTSGSIEFQDVTLRYRPSMPLAVQGMTLSLHAGERLGICGRTGAGKSSVSVALLRLVELESGAVLIDGVNTCNVGLHTLRRAIAVVPQDPFLFDGTIAQNLDPIGVHNDSKLRESIELVGLSFDLKSEVGKGGGQLSSGERQFLAMARASLNSTHILLMDEPTASCDARTDELLQTLVTEVFVGRTVLCIAHRLNTILGYDRVLVMEDGRVGEVGTPAELMANPNTRFARMIGGMHHIACTDKAEPLEFLTV